MNSRKEKNINLSAIAKAVIIITSIAQLIFTRVHIKALLLLENEICGFVMFLLILFGLVTMFETTRIRSDKKLEKAMTAVFCAITCGFGGFLITLYQSALLHQRALETAAVSRAVIFCAIIVAVYLLSGIMMIADLVKHS